MIELKIFVDETGGSLGIDTLTIQVRRKFLRKVYSMGNALAVNVAKESGEALQKHLASYGIASSIVAMEGFDRLVIDGDHFPADVQESVDTWEADRSGSVIAFDLRAPSVGQRHINPDFVLDRQGSRLHRKEGRILNSCVRVQFRDV